MFTDGVLSRISIASLAFLVLLSPSIAKILAANTGFFSTCSLRCLSMCSPQGVYLVRFLACSWYSFDRVLSGRWLSPMYSSPQKLHQSEHLTSILRASYEHLTSILPAKIAPKRASYDRYVDECLMVWNHGETELTRFLKHCIQQHPNIQFTWRPGYPSCPTQVAGSTEKRKGRNKTNNSIASSFLLGQFRQGS